MKILRRRLLLAGGASVLGAGAVAFGGSLAVCSFSTERIALLRPLLVAVRLIPDPDSIGTAYLRDVGEDMLFATLENRSDLFQATLIPNDHDRQGRLADIFDTDFRDGKIVTADRWIVSQAEALISGVWVA